MACPFTGRVFPMAPNVAFKSSQVFINTRWAAEARQAESTLQALLQDLDQLKSDQTSMSATGFFYVCL